MKISKLIINYSTKHVLKLPRYYGINNFVYFLQFLIQCASPNLTSRKGGGPPNITFPL